MPRHQCRQWSSIVFLAILACGTLAAAAPVTLKVRIKSAIVEMPLDQYVAAVLAGECSTFRSDEGIKAMAVAARSYALNLRGRHAAQGYDLCSTTHCQRLDPDAVTPRLASLAAQTSGVLLWFEGKPAFACYSRRCGGTTEDAGAVWGGLRAPFLRSHADPYCPRQGTGEWHWSAPAADIAAALRRSQLRAPAEMDGIDIAQWTSSGRALVLALVGRAEQVRDIGEFVPFRHRPCAGLQYGAQRSLVGGAGRHAIEVRGRGGGPRRRDVPARGRPDGPGGSQLSRDSGVLLSRARNSGRRRAGLAWRRMGGETRGADDDAAGPRRRQCWRPPNGR